MTTPNPAYKYWKMTKVSKVHLHEVVLLAVCYASNRGAGAVVAETSVSVLAINPMHAVATNCSMYLCLTGER